MQVGDKVRAVVSEINKPMTGVVVYMHPRGRYYTLEFALDGGKLRESYKFV